MDTNALKDGLLIVKGIQRKLLNEVTFSSDKSLAEKRQIRVIAASGRADRVGDIIDIKGIETQNFMKNPVILWAHDHYSLPVAKAIEVGIEKGKLVMLLQFATYEEYAFADTVYRMILGGYLNGVSIGARVKDAEWIKDNEGNIVGRKFNVLELLELSVVPIPADSKALVIAVKSGKVSCDEFEECITKTLEAPLDLLDENQVQLSTSTDGETTQSSDASEKGPNSEEDALMKEQIEKLEARIAELEKLLKGQSEAAEQTKKTADAIQTLFGAVLSQMATKKVPDTQAIIDALPEGSPVADVTKKIFATLEAMNTKLSGSR